MASSRIASCAAAILAGAAGIVVGADAADASHGDNPSAGIYRIPFVDGTAVHVTADAHDHGGPNGNKDRIDMVGNTELVAAAANGIIRWIDDHNGDSFDRGDG